MERLDLVYGILPVLSFTHDLQLFFITQKHFTKAFAGEFFVINNNCPKMHCWPL